jgi:predicted GIY-YIG superfamily endonuclease
MMDFELEEAIGDAIDEIAAQSRTPAGQERFAAIVERLLESDVPIERWMGSGVMMAVADQAAAQYEREEEGRVYSIYALGRVGETKCFYLGVSQDVAARYTRHMKAARCNLGHESQLPVAVRVRAELEPNGPGVWVETLLPNLTQETAKCLEALMIAGLVRGGVALENRELRGQHGPPNRHPEGTPEYDEARRAYHRDRRATDPEYRAAWQDASREYQRRQYATPAGRTRHLAKQALADLKKGGSLTLTRRHHIESAGRIEDARAIIEARGDAWPEGEVTSR